MNTQPPQKPHNFPSEAIRACAEWWRDQLPGRGPLIKEHEFERMGEKGMKALAPGLLGRRAPVTDAQAEKFVTALIEEIEKLIETQPDLSEGINLYIDYDPPRPLRKALEKAGLSSLALPVKTGTALYSDGQIFAPSSPGQKPLAHKGAPNVPYILPNEIDTSQGSYFRKATRYLIAETNPEQTYPLVRTYGSDVSYFEGKAYNGDVLVVSADDTPFFDSLTLQDLLDVKKTNKEGFVISNLYMDSGEKYKDGANHYGTTAEKLDDQGRVRMLSPVFCALRATEDFATWNSSGYARVRKGDFVLISDDDGYRRLSIAPQEDVKNNHTWLPSTKNGKITSEEPYVVLPLRKDIHKSGQKAPLGPTV